MIYLLRHGEAEAGHGDDAEEFRGGPFDSLSMKALLRPADLAAPASNPD